MTSPVSGEAGANETEVPVIDQCLALMADGGYFVRREPGEGAQAEYWDAKKDPDGKIRDIESERPQRVEDLRYIAEFVNALPAGRVLDIGCGLGELLQQVDVRHEAYGLDTSPRSVEICREKTRAEVLLGVLEGAFVEEGWFDAAVAHHVIEHVDEPVPFVREVFRLLKPGGYFICGTPDFSSAAARRFGDRFRLLHDPTHVSLFTEDSLVRLFRDTGFVVERIEKPFFDTRFATEEAMTRMLSGEGEVSPAFYGSFMTVFARKPG